ncbi:MAG: phosphatase PAP2 family protein [Clostridiales bacterium]|nr:phosphatase PAP2 family protein [Clostridiales bacterium]
MTNAIQNFDAGALLFIQENLRIPLMDAFMVFITKLGDIGFIWITIGLVLLVPKKTRRRAFNILICLLSAYLINDLLIKELVARPRPYDTIGDLSILVKPLSSYSFPSGHSSSSFAAALALTLAFGRKGALSYIPAVLIAFSRCYVGVHYPSDVLGGALVGTLVTLATYKLLDRYIKSDLIPKKKT